jgi:hypothetical protein
MVGTVGLNVANAGIETFAVGDCVGAGVCPTTTSKSINARNK